MTPRRFNVTGPCVPGRDFMAPLAARLSRPLAALRRGESLTLTRGRQTGKTTLLRALAGALAKDCFAVALCSLQVAEDQTLTGLLRVIEAAVRAACPLPAPPKWQLGDPQSLSFLAWLSDVVRAQPRPIVLMLDEYDAPPRKLVTALLRSLRAALTLADEARPFVHAIVLCGKTHPRDLRDELRPPGDESRGTGSLWNVALPLPLPPLSSLEVDALLDAYAEESGVALPESARAEIYAQTRGQPYLVSRICHVLDDQLGAPRTAVDPAAPAPTALLAPSLSPAPALAPDPAAAAVALVRAAAEQLADEDSAHLCGLSDVLLGRREAQELVLRLLGGEDVPLSRTSETQSYLLDAGLLSPSESRQLVELTCPIYASHLRRWLTEH